MYVLAHVQIDHTDNSPGMMGAVAISHLSTDKINIFHAHFSKPCFLLLRTLVTWQKEREKILKTNFKSRELAAVYYSLEYLKENFSR